MLSLNPVQDGLNIEDPMDVRDAGTMRAGRCPASTVTVTADPAIKEFFATFSVRACALAQFRELHRRTSLARVRGRSMVNDVPYTIGRGSMSPPERGRGWSPSRPPGTSSRAGTRAYNQNITGFLNRRPGTAPTVVRPRFQLARRINFETVPAELELFADRGRVPTPSTLEWAYGTTHTLGASEPADSEERVAVGLFQVERRRRGEPRLHRR